MDKEKFNTIVGNFMSNALKFTPPGGSVTLRLEQMQQSVRVSVSDTGAGIPTQDLLRIFDRYYQIPHQNRRLAQGAGIGLSLCRELATLLGGRVWAESPRFPDGSGSVFYFDMPVKPAQGPGGDMPAQPELAVAALPEVRQPETQPASGVRLLLVEDNVYLQQFIQLEFREYAVELASNGLEALARLERKDLPLPDLIISDVLMPQFDGMELLTRLRAQERWQEIPVIMLTAKASLEDRLSALRIGVDDYLTKPFVAEELRARIQNLLQRRSVRQEARQEQSPEEVPLIPASAQAWLQELEQLVLRELGNSRLNQDFLADELFLSKRQLQRNIRLHTGMTANQFIREIRLNQARTLLESGNFRTVAEVSHAVGYDDQHYFSTLYEERFGKRPSGFYTRIWEDAKD